MKKKFEFFPAPDGLSGRVVFSFDKKDEDHKIDTDWLQSGKLRFKVKVKNGKKQKVSLIYEIVDEAAPAEPVPAVSSDSLVGGPVEEEDSFYIENSPTAIHCGWKYTLRAHVPAGMNGKVRWEIGEEGAGTIDQNGQYTAPEKPGAYEVIARFIPGKTDDASSAEPADESLEASVYLIVL